MNTIKPLALLVVALLCASCQPPVRAESSASSKAPAKIVEVKPADLKGSKQLVNHDNLIPTQNRTQAMAVEATTGQLPAGENAMLAKQTAVKKRASTVHSNSRRHSVRRRSGLSHAEIRRGILEAARGH
jgi:hypothetical protein